MDSEIQSLQASLESIMHPRSSKHDTSAPFACAIPACTRQFLAQRAWVYVLVRKESRQYRTPNDSVVLIMPHPTILFAK